MRISFMNTWRSEAWSPLKDETRVEGCRQFVQKDIQNEYNCPLSVSEYSPL